MKNIAGLMKQASQMQKKMEDMQAALEAVTMEGSATSQGFKTLPSPVIALDNCAVSHHAATLRNDRQR